MPIHSVCQDKFTIYFARRTTHDWLSEGFKTEIFPLASGDGELKMTFNDLMRELSKEVENSTLRQNLYRLAADVVRSLLYS